jgi:hypothetical protein
MSDILYVIGTQMLLGLQLYLLCWHIIYNILLETFIHSFWSISHWNALWYFLFKYMYERSILSQLVLNLIKLINHNLHGSIDYHDIIIVSHVCYIFHLY